MLNRNTKQRSVGVFYDGNYFLHVSNYYNYVHERKSRISIAGIHNFISQKVAELEGGDLTSKHCQIVDAHYFRGRLTAGEASQRGNQLYFDRVFDDILMHEGVTTHYIPVRQMQNGYKFDKDIDVWLSLEAFEQTFYKRFDMVVLIASDGDYTQLCRKLNTLGSSVLLLSWDFEYTDDYGNRRVTKTSQDLFNTATYPIAMFDTIENETGEIIDGLFVDKEPRHQENGNSAAEPSSNGSIHESEIMSIKSGYGFIRFPPNNLFFHYQNLNGVDFENLDIGNRVQFEIVKNDEGDDVAINVEVLQ
jgi:cold shock CspA family protein/uncharacterized LabA/DUF88 family protein